MTFTTLRKAFWVQSHIRFINATLTTATLKTALGSTFQPLQHSQIYRHIVMVMFERR